jgi:hypothetical protein
MDAGLRRLRREIKAVTADWVTQKWVRMGCRACDYRRRICWVTGWPMQKRNAYRNKNFLFLYTGALGSVNKGNQKGFP